jgi:hypothetical protein
VIRSCHLQEIAYSKRRIGREFRVSQIIQIIGTLIEDVNVLIAQELPAADTI